MTLVGQSRDVTSMIEKTHETLVLLPTKLQSSSACSSLISNLRQLSQAPDREVRLAGADGADEYRSSA